MSAQKAYGWGSQLVVAAIFAALGAGLLYWFVSFSERPARTHREPFQGNYAEEPLLAALTTNRLESYVQAILAAGTSPGERWQGRYTGSPGFYRTEALIVEAFRAAGLAVTTQEFQVTVPVTEYCELLDEAGRPLEGVTLYPFLPSALEPTILPPQGIRGKLVATESTDMKSLNGQAPSNTIVLTYLDAARDWSSLAGIGVPALIVREDELVRRLRASPDLAGAWQDLTSLSEVGFPRFLARGPIEQAAGKAVTIRCKVTWQTRTVRNVLGVLRADRPTREALVLNAFYDSNSLVPELAPGAEQALSLAALLDYAQGFAPYRGKLSRDLIFVATAGHAQAMAGAIRLMEAIETFTSQQSDYRPVDARMREQERFLDYTRRAQGVLDDLARDTARTNTPVLTSARWLAEEAGFRTWFEAGLGVVTGENNLDFQERARKAKLAYQRAGSPVYREGFDPSPTRSTDEDRKDPANTHAMLNAYLQARRTVTDADNMMSTPLWKLAANTNMTAWRVVEQARGRFHELAAFHERQIRQLRDQAGLRACFQPYEKTLTVNLELYSGGVKQKQDLSMLVGLKDPGSVVEPQSSELAAAISEKIPRVAGKPAWKLVSWGARDGAGGPGQPNPNGAGPVMESVAWHTCGRSAFTVLNYEFFPPKVCTPEDTWEGLTLDVLHEQVPVIGRALLAVAHGRVPFKSIPPTRDGITAVRGAVYASAGGSSLVPTHPVTIRTAAQILTEVSLPSAKRGVNLCPVVLTDPYGQYEYPIVLGMARWSVFSVNAARFDGDGRLVYFKDSSVAAQGNYRNTNLSGSEVLAGVSQPPKLVNIPVFRCSRVALFDRGNPRTLKSFQGVSYLDRQGLSAPPRVYRTGNVDFMDPDFRFHVGFMDGAAGNKEILQYRAFMLNIDPQASTNLAGESELEGRGYLAEETPVLALPHLDAAASMLRTNEKRLELQKRFGMADEQMLAFHERSKERLVAARAKLAANEPAQAVIAAGTSLAYAITNHPVIRDRISQAVIGILWYLALLVPFVFFAEKLLFGYADIRRQILACGVIFVVVFVLLRLFHPAFEMVRSSLMILLGFVISLLTVLVIVMVTSKFKQNIKDLRKREGQVEGADINRAGVVGTAFMLGLNNMRRRKVRTGLTCITLILITFVMICFTSVSTDLVNIEFPTGRSNWNGIMLRNPNYTTLADTELASIRRIYGDRYPIATSRWLVPSLSVASMTLANPEIHVDREFQIGEIKNSKRIKFSGCLALDWNEPQFSGIDRYLLTTNGWFPRPPQTRAERLAAATQGYKEKNYVILPDSAAAELGLSVEDVNTGHPIVTIRDAEYEVLGIMDTVKLSKTLGLDGRSIMPYDINSVQSMGTKGKELVVPEDVGRLSPQQVLIVNQLPPGQNGEGHLTAACSILFPSQPYRLETSAPEQPPADYKEQRRTVLEYLERIGEPAFYAVDGVAYYGSRQRSKSFAGLLELLVPILIAALTVFNTMRGSVYERKDEIYVYNAVGVAPNHVFFIFMAEACVYAVVGAMMGYLLSQGTGRLLTSLGMTGGLNMDYSSIETIYASLAIMAATLLSTILPARDAARMASPADTTHWTIPEAQGDVMQFNLPFTFTAHDRIAVISYFYRWLDANGMGSSGTFYCSAPETSIRKETIGTKGLEDVPVLATTIWLKPYDLGVSQRVEIALPTDPETGEYIARITFTRLSGHVTTWQRRVMPFLSTLRKQFLNWRVTTPADRTELFAEAKRMLEAGAPAKKES
jgi:hypothetical protein